MSNQNAAIQINFKTKKDGMLINLYAADALELDTLLDTVSQRIAALVDLETTVESMATVKTVFPGAEVINQGAAPMPAHAQPAQQAQPAAQGYAPAPAAKPQQGASNRVVLAVIVGIALLALVVWSQSSSKSDDATPAPTASASTEASA